MMVLAISAIVLAVLAGCSDGDAGDTAAAEDASAEGEPAASDSAAAGSDDADDEPAEAEAQPAQMSPSDQDVEFQTTEAIGMSFSWRIIDDQLEVELSAPTTGWVAVGLKPSRAMLDANMLIGYVSGSDVVVTDQFGTAVNNHRRDSDLGGSIDVEAISGSEENGTTTIAFRIPLDSGDEYDQPLAAGETIPILLAYGPNGADDTRTYHADRAGAEITL
jgi:hypothetical protein